MFSDDGGNNRSTTGKINYVCHVNEHSLSIQGLHTQENQELAQPVVLHSALLN